LKESPGESQEDEEPGADFSNHLIGHVYLRPSDPLENSSHGSFSFIFNSLLSSNSREDIWATFL